MNSDRPARYSVLFILSVSTTLILFCSTAWADALKQGQGPCAADFAKFCKDIPPGGGRIAACLNEHENDFSAACKQHLAQVKQRNKDLQEACMDDSQRFCKDVQPGGRLMKCLKAHEAELSQACREKLPKSKRGK